MSRLAAWRASTRDRVAQQWPYALAALLLWCAMLPLALPLSVPAQSAAAAAADSEWPREWRGQSLQPLALSEVEHRFATRFPGRIARFALADQSELVLRDVTRPTRLLHPAADCWRGLGWQLQATTLRADDDGVLWRCFEARRAGQRVRVCERIVGAEGESFTDTSAWFWAASLGRSAGPWQAVTHVEGL